MSRHYGLQARNVSILLTAQSPRLAQPTCPHYRLHPPVHPRPGQSYPGSINLQIIMDNMLRRVVSFTGAGAVVGGRLLVRHQLSGITQPFAYQWTKTAS